MKIAQEKKPMIGKIGKGKGFAGLTKYILEKESSELLCTNLAGETPQDFYQQLSATQQLNQRVQFPVSHISISFDPGEKPANQQLNQIVEGVLVGMGFEQNLYFAAAHNDRDHFHLHIAASRINSVGECVSDWWDKRRLEKVLRGLEQQFDLTSVPCSWEVNRTAPTTGQKRRMMQEQQAYSQGQRDTEPQHPISDKIQDAIANAIAQTEDFTSYVQALFLKEVQVAAKVTREGVVDGLRYEMAGVRFQASKLGHAQKATIPGLQRQGIKFNLERDAKELAKIAYSNKQKDQRLPYEIEQLIKTNPANQALTISPHHQLRRNQPHRFKSLQIEPTLGFCWNEIEPLLTTNEQPSASTTIAFTGREVWEKYMLNAAIEQLETANSSTHPDLEIAAFGGHYYAVRHLPTQMLIVADTFKKGRYIQYAAQKDQPAKLCNFSDKEKQTFVNQIDDFSEPLVKKREDLEL